MLVLAILLLCHLRQAELTVCACLSNPSVACSVASGESCPLPPVSTGGMVTAFTSPIYASGQYQGFLGNNVHARAYSEVNMTSPFATADRDLACTNMNNCSWRNDKDDQLDWIVGEGEIHATKLSFITGSNILPGGSFLILASDPRVSQYSGALISPAIGCQLTSGLLSFRYWRSRARRAGAEPDLDVCTRNIPDTTLLNCLTIEPTDNHTILASIPAMFAPFEIVIRGYGFENQPEGGLILVDTIDYRGILDTPEHCAVVEENTIPPAAIADDIEEASLTTVSTLIDSPIARERERNSQQISGFAQPLKIRGINRRSNKVVDSFHHAERTTTTTPTTTTTTKITTTTTTTRTLEEEETEKVTDEADEIEESEIIDEASETSDNAIENEVDVPDDTTKHLTERGILETATNDIIMINDVDTEENCRSLECNLDENIRGCEYRRVGSGAKGEGFRVGWMVASVDKNAANLLTGIHTPPENDTGQSFLVADFPGFSLSRTEHRYVLESPEFILDGSDAHIAFLKYLATKNIDLEICSDDKGQHCFWNVYQNSTEPFGRKWTREVVKIPNDIHKFFIICRQQLWTRANVGQVGLSAFGLFQDSEGKRPFC